MAFLFILSAARAQPDPLRELIAEYRGSEGVETVRIGGLFLDIGAVFVEKGPDRRLVRKLSQFRMLRFEPSSGPGPKQLQAFEATVIEQGFEELLDVRKGTEHTRIFILSTEKHIRRVLLFTEDQRTGDQAIYSLRGKLRYDELSDLELF